MSNNVSAKIIVLPSYSLNNFINREEEVGLISKKVEALANKGSLIDERTVIFLGQRGIGKSWLMLHLYKMLEAIPEIMAVILNLDNYSDIEPDGAITKIINELGNILFKDKPLSEVTLPDLSREFMRNLRLILAEKPLVLLVDTVFESDWHLLALLERYLLGPLATEDNVLIVMAGRGQPYPWKTPELRLRAKFKDLEEFDPEHTKAQLRQYNLESTAQFDVIQKFSRGNPLANYVLGVQSETPETGLNQAISELLEIISNPEERLLLRDYLEALSVLRTFGEEQIPTMLAAYYDDDSYKEWTPSQARQVRENIVKWSFAHWDETKKGYVIDSTFLNLVQCYLNTESQRNKWKTLNCAAYQLYQDWMNRYERTRKRWEEEAEYHLDQLKELGFTLGDCNPQS